MKKLAIASFALSFAVAAHAAGDATAGEKVFAQCAACHTVGASAMNSVGPVLNGVVGRAAGTFPGYRYSSAMRKSGLTWDEGTLSQYLEGPEKMVPGTKMLFPGIQNKDDRANVIAYLKQQTAK